MSLLKHAQRRACLVAGLALAASLATTSAPCFAHDLDQTTTFPGGCPDGKTYKVALTFDDGPSRRTTGTVIDILEDTKTPATFFVLGEHFSSENKNTPEWQLLRRERAEGFHVGSHTYHHLQHTKLSEEEIVQNITRSIPIIAFELAPILRLPYGDGAFPAHTEAKKAKSALIMSVVQNAGFKHVLWDVDSEDWRSAAWPHLMDSVLHQICTHHGGVALFHDIQPHTAKNLREWIRQIRAAGHTLVDLKEFVPEATQQYHAPASLQSLGIAQCKTPDADADVLPQKKQLESIGTQVNSVIARANGSNNE